MLRMLRILRMTGFTLPLCAVLLIFGCTVSRESVIVGGMPLVPLSSPHEDAYVSAAYMSREDLVSLVGENSNPFLTLGNTPLLVFDVSVSDPVRDVRLLYDAIVLRHAGGSRSPLPHFYITQYWDNKLGRYSANKSIGDWTSNRKTYSRWSSGKVTYNVDRYMIPAKRLVKAGEHYEGLVVFEGAPPERGSLILTVPLYADTGQLLTTFDFEYRPAY